jgi:hypothetical protein
MQYDTCIYFQNLTSLIKKKTENFNGLPNQGEESRRSLPKQTRWRMRPKSRIFPFFSEIRDVHV